jgi:hypothetical protein
MERTGCQRTGSGASASDAQLPPVPHSPAPPPLLPCRGPKVHPTRSSRTSVRSYAVSKLRSTWTGSWTKYFNTVSINQFTTGFPRTLCTRSCSNKHTNKGANEKVVHQLPGTHTAFTSTHTPPPHTGFPMSAHLSRLRLFQRHLRSLVWAWVWVWDWIHSHTPPRTRSPSSRHPPFTHYPFPPRSLMCGGQASPHKPRLVVSHSTCPPLSSSPHAHSFVLGTAVINTHSA